MYNNIYKGFTIIYIYIHTHFLIKMLSVTENYSTKNISIKIKCITKCFIHIHSDQ